MERRITQEEIDQRIEENKNMLDKKYERYKELKKEILITFWYKMSDEQKMSMLSEEKQEEFKKLKKELQKEGYVQ